MPVKQALLPIEPSSSSEMVHVKKAWFSVCFPSLERKEIITSRREVE